MGAPPPSPNLPGNLIFSTGTFVSLPAGVKNVGSRVHRLQSGVVGVGHAAESTRLQWFRLTFGSACLRRHEKTNDHHHVRLDSQMHHSFFFASRCQVTDLRSQKHSDSKCSLNGTSSIFVEAVCVVKILARRGPTGLLHIDQMHFRFL